MPLLFVIGAIALVVGPIMMLQPSKRQQTLIRLRQAASQRGIRVRLETHDGNNKSMAVYSLAWPMALDIEPFCLKRQKFSHKLHFLDDWHWDDDRRSPSRWSKPLQDIIKTLPQDIVGIEGNRQSFGVFWLEQNNQTTLAMIENLLRKSQQMLLNTITSREVNTTLESKS